MGAADIVPGVSGGTIALIVGIYEKLVTTIRTGTAALAVVLKGDWAGMKRSLSAIDWTWIISLGIGILAAVALLSSVIENLLHDQPIAMAALFFGLVSGSLVIAWRLITNPASLHLAVTATVGIAFFLILGLRSDTTATAADTVTHPWWIFFAAGALAICAMILPGISGSFILVMIGMYADVLGAVTSRDLAALAAFAIGAVAGLAGFSTLLNWALTNHHDLVMAIMVGLLVGSLRVVWPWPNGTWTTDLAAPSGTVIVPILLAIVGAGAVVGLDRLARR